MGNQAVIIAKKEANHTEAAPIGQTPNNTKDKSENDELNELLTTIEKEEKSIE